MKTTVSRYMFQDAFKSIRPDNFSYAGLNALFNYLEELEEGTGEELELDVIAICCDFTEYQNIQEFNEAYGEEFESMEELQDHTTVINIDGESFIIEDY